MTVMLNLLLVSSVSFCCVFFVCYLIKRFDHLHASISHDHDIGSVQKYHDEPVPRVGGVAIMAGLFISFCATANVFDPGGVGQINWCLLLISALPVFICGFIEDITKQVSGSIRLLLSFISAGIAAALLGTVVHTVNIPALDAVVAWSPVAIIFTVFGVGGVTHSFNLIDGYNGLASGVNVILMAGMAFVAYLLGDLTVLMLSFFVIMATLGFFVWNWPRGHIFLGDGGAYLLGFLSAVILLMLLNRNPIVSTWFGLVLFGYPVFETLYSIFRRKVYQRVSHDTPDDQHLHQLIYKLIVRVRGNDHGSWISNNSLTSVPIWFGVSLGTFFSVCFYDNTQVLMWFLLVGVLLYKLTYRVLLRLNQKNAPSAR